MPKIDETREFIPVNIALLTVSDTRTLKDDRSGDILFQRASDDGHVVVERAIVKDEVHLIKKKLNLKKQEVYYLIGSDSLIDLKNWKEPKKILDEAKVIVAIRPGFRPSDIPHWILQDVHFANIPRFELSSSKIRSRWVEDLTIRYMVTLPIWDYINKNNLYSFSNDS